MARIFLVWTVVSLLTATGCAANTADPYDMVGSSSAEISDFWREFWFEKNMEAPLETFMRNRAHFHPYGFELDWTSDGCSLPDKQLQVIEDHFGIAGWAAAWLARDYEKRFDPMCRRHDYCYRNAAPQGWVSQSLCDDTFHQDMDDYCTTRTCRAISDIFYTAVKTGGSRYFE